MFNKTFLANISTYIGKKRHPKIPPKTRRRQAFSNLGIAHTLLGGTKGGGFGIGIRGGGRGNPT